VSAADSRKPWMARLADSAKARVRTSRAGGSSRLGPGAAKAPDGASHRARAAQGLGLTSERLRERMVERLRSSGVIHPAVLAAMAGIERHRFVDEALASRAYEDTALPIGFEQTISQPLIVALMTEAVLGAPRVARVLEVGTGCGYQAAVLAQCCGEVYSIERISALHQRARLNLRALRLANLRLVCGDGMQGLAEAAPFDAMLIAAAASDLPAALLGQLAIGGRAVAPLGGRDEQLLCVITRAGPDQYTRQILERVRFVPLLPGVE